MTEDDSEIEFNPDTLQKEASKRVETVLEELANQQSKEKTDSDISVDIEDLLRTYEEHRANMILYERVAKAEEAAGQTTEVNIADVAGRYTDILIEGGYDTKSTLQEIPELRQRTNDLISSLQQDDSIEYIPDTLFKISDEIEEVGEIYETLNVTIDPGTFDDIL